MRPQPDAAIDEWLDWLATLHPHEIELGLERTADVAARLGLLESAAPVITVAGTNGKGSVCAFLEAMLAVSGCRVGLYTSPHLVRYHERVRIAGREIDDVGLRTSLTRVDDARGDIPLTFFEFGTLAALERFRAAAVDVIVLETGLGGRLDATNVIDADVAVITSIGVDHAEWLGSDRRAVAYEKAGIARRGRPLVMADPDPPAGWAEIVARTGALETRRERDYGHAWCRDGAEWSWWMGGRSLEALPPPALAGGYQVDNAATALAALHVPGAPAPSDAGIRAGLRRARVPGRFEVMPGDVEIILDVGHNPQAAATLARSLAERPPAGRTLCVIAVYADKDVAGIVAALGGLVDEWFCAPLPAPRGLAAALLAGHIADQVTTGSPAWCCTSPEAALERARAVAAAGDRIVVTGSFATVARTRGHFL